jgi:hypothetical protein
MTTFEKILLHSENRFASVLHAAKLGLSLNKRRYTNKGGRLFMRNGYSSNDRVNKSIRKNLPITTSCLVPLEPH